MEKIKAIVCGIGFVLLVVVIFLGINSANKVKGAESFLCLQKAVIIDNGVVKDQWITDTDIDKVFSSVNLIVYPEDKVGLSLPLDSCKGVIITINRAPVINLKIGKNQTIIRSWASKVKDLLAEQNIVMGAKDTINQNLNTKITTGMNVILTHWGERTEKKEEAIAYSVTKQPSADLVIGNTEVQTAGKDGKKLVTYKITSVNGDDVSSEKIDEQIITPATDEILLYGTKPPTTYLGTGIATWYVISNEMIGACNLAPMGSQLIVTDLDNGHSIQVTDSGGGGFGSNVVIDLSSAAFNALDSSASGVIHNIKVELINQ